MSRFSGPQGEGAMWAFRAKKRAEAEARNARTPVHRRRRYRRSGGHLTPQDRLLRDIFGAAS